VRNLLIGIAGSLIAATIIAVVQPLRSMALLALTWAWGVITGTGAHLISPSGVPWWLVYAGSFVLAWVGWRTIRRLNSNEDSWLLQYREDEFMGLRWRWSYRPDGQAKNVGAFCPRCDLQSPFKADVHYFAIACRNCGYSSDVMFESYTDVDIKGALEIQRRIRTEEWKNATT